MCLGNPDPLKELASVAPSDCEARVTTDCSLLYINRKTGAEHWVRSRITSHELEETYPVLPSGFEKRTTREGRSYYVDHATKTTSWVRPNEPRANETKDTTDGIEQLS